SANVIANNSNLYDALTFNNTAEIAQRIMDAFVEGTYDKVEVIYNQFKNAATQIVQIEQFLPLLPVVNEKAAASDYIFEPSKEEIILNLIPTSLKTQLFKAVLDSNASEHGARMTAMHKATDNAKDLRDDLK